MRRAITVALSCLLFFSMTAIAADWVLIAADQDRELEIDRQSVRPNKGAWFKYINTPAKNGGCAGVDKKLANSKYYIEANCKDFTIRTKQTIAYSEDGSVIDYCGYNTPKSAFIEYAPETLGEVYFKAICYPKERVENGYARLVRRAKAVEVARNEMAEEVARNSKQAGAQCTTSSECAGALLCAKVENSTMRCMSSQEAARNSQPKPLGAQCTTSSECAGILICAKADGGLTTRCMSSETAIRSNF